MKLKHYLTLYTPNRLHFVIKLNYQIYAYIYIIRQIVYGIGFCAIFSDSTPLASKQNQK